MKKLLSIIILTLTTGICVLFLTDKATQGPQYDSGTEAMEENHEGRNAYFNKLLADPATGRIPDNMRALELEFDKTLPVFNGLKRSEQWSRRGPNNLGGRTRGIGINIDNPEILLAGGVTGGIFKSTDGGKSWNRTQCPLYSITCLVQDQRPGKTLTWYAGTGELYGSSGTATGAYYLGAGILKSTDGGDTWAVLPSTSGSSQSSFDTEFDGIWNIVIDHSNLVDDELYVATYGSIYRSLNGGKTWSRKLTGSTSSSYATEVAVTASGILYATLSSEGSGRGIYRSTDGLSWANITPSGFPAVYGRTAIGISPSDPDLVYFLVAGTTNSGLKSVNFQGDVEWNSFWNYRYLSGNGSGTGGTWVDRSLNLPSLGGDFGNFNTQGGYDLYVRVKPDDANTVFIGATNLWRTTDGLASKSNTAWIGGYAVNTTRPDFKMYDNHHPDQHNLIFFPGNPSKAISTHDGGISRTENVMASSVTWTALNHDYITSQFYTVAVDHSKPLDNRIIGGLQDNGTHFTNMHGNSPWQMSLSADGSYCAFKEGTNEIIASAQQGRILRLEVDASGLPLKYARIDPAQLYKPDYDFINPFALDPNDQKILYLPARKRLFRNLNIDAKALTTTFDSTRWSTPLWEELVNCVPPAGEFSAIAASRCNPNTLYYATDAGKLFKVNNANSGQPIPVNITGTNFSTGNINCIALDPKDSNRIMVVFSNYNIISLFATTDGGKVWRNVSGNLEASPNGTGDGPSCRWAAVMYLLNGNRTWFVGTSTGLFSTNDLSATQVVWIKQSPGLIGSSIVSMIDTRLSDYLVVAATHGNGMFSANIANEWQITSVSEDPAPFRFNAYPNPLTGNELCIDYSMNPGKIHEFGLYNAIGEKVLLKPEDVDMTKHNNMRLNLEQVPSGNYWLVLNISGVEQTQKITIVR